MLLESLVLITVAYSTDAANYYLHDLILSGSYEVLDLTHKFNNHSIYWPGGKRFKFTKKFAQVVDRRFWYLANDFEANEHGGTHVDAPRHFDENGKFLGELPLENFIVPMHVIDVSNLVDGNPDFVLRKGHVSELLKPEETKKPYVIIFKFGWSQYYNNKMDYMGADPEPNPGAAKFPGLSQEVAEWIVTSYQNVVGIGVDTASVDCGSSVDFPVHITILNAGLYSMENIKLDIPIPEYGCIALALPMDIADGTGGPLRLAAICPRYN